jgi:cytochrome c oxidase accessory protein FixG
VTELVAKGRVLPTLNEDGSRHWIRPKPAGGVWWHRRRVLAYILMFVFLGLPYVHINGMPAILLDLPRRHFAILGVNFLATDTLLFMLLMASAIVAIFFFSALFGRVWCGWACPQTVYMEFVFRPLERLLEGGRSGSMILDKTRAHFHWRRLQKYAAYFIIALFLARTFIAYFIEVGTFAQFVWLSPSEHPSAFLVMVAATVLIFYDFAFFREQTCLIVCPYGRGQAVLLDNESLIVAYDVQRGEPRHRFTEGRPADAGDCVMCNSCVLTCPTGIDIRNGLQMECIHCTQCMDACDAIMDQVGKPRGLIRYASIDQLAGKPRQLLRPRTVLYPSILALLLGAFIFTLETREKADVTIMRSQAEPFSMEQDGRVANQVRVKIVNRSQRERAYAISVLGADSAQVIAPESPLRVTAGEQRTTSVFVLLPMASFTHGRRDITVHITDGDDFTTDIPFNLLGPTTQTRAP